MPTTSLRRAGHELPAQLTDEHPDFPGQVVLLIGDRACACSDVIRNLVHAQVPDDYTAGDLVTAWVHERIGSGGAWKPDRDDPEATLLLRFLRSDATFAMTAADLEWYWDWKR